MINTISSSTAAMRTIQYRSPTIVRAPIATAGGFDAAMAASSVATNRSTASVAKVPVAAGAVPADFDMKYYNVEHTQAEFAAYYAEGARQISESQGLPYGQYDFTKVSPKQLHIISTDMVVNHGASLDDTSGFLPLMLNGTSTSNWSMSEEPMDMMSIVTGQQEHEASVGNSMMADLLQRSLDLMAAAHQAGSGSQEFDIAELTDLLKRAAGANTTGS